MGRALEATGRQFPLFRLSELDFSDGDHSLLGQFQDCRDSMRRLTEEWRGRVGSSSPSTQQGVRLP